ncbi:MAG: aminopeptidase [Planctomycetaceae bacterium]|nr:aminopeptidase [Planctomycetaceae bacterium]
MTDPRITHLAELLIDHSCQLESGQKLLIEAFDLPSPELVSRLVAIASRRGAIPVVNLKSNEVLRAQYQNATESSMTLLGELESHVMSQVDAYIGVRGANNSNEFADVPTDQMTLFQKHWWKPVHVGIRVPQTRWVVLRYPTASMAQAANMSTSAFEDYFFEVCTADYAIMAENQKPLAELMDKTKEVRITAPGTDLSFSIEGMPAIPCAGECNIPDGEVFTAPVRESVNGTIQYNTGSRYQGTVFENIRFEFQEGKIVDAKCRGKTETLNGILDADDGARFVGEWSLGCNNAVKHPMLDTLFDEKIGGSFHLTPGNAYDEADNGNRSQVHWDLVLIQTPEYGGGEIYFDGVLIRKDGKFLPEKLQALNAGL